MTKVKLKDLMDRYCIVECELYDVFGFVEDLLYLRRKELEKNEPYALKSIDNLRIAEHEVSDLVEYVESTEGEQV